MKWLGFILAVSLAACASTPKATPGCPPAGWDRARLDALKAAKFEIEDVGERQAFAKAITACLASPDPKLRDGVAFEALTHMARGKQLFPETMKAITADLYERMQARDAAGFEAPFAALALAEMARADRIEAYLTDAQLAVLVDRSTHFLTGVSDYRGFDETEGWRHGVAHGADLLQQLVLNPRVAREQLLAIRDAVATQIAPAAHSYIDGESERLSRPILFMARRGVFTEAEWTAWLAAVAGPGELGAWGKAFASRAGLARVHNVKGFVYALWTNVTAGDDASDDVLKPGLLAALRTLP